MPGSGKCKTEEVEKCSSLDPPEGCFCKMCISCPEGFGPTRPCGGRYSTGTIIKCKPCPNGVSYSKEHSIASCEPCHQCDGRETLRKCTPNSDTNCSTKCRVGYIMSHAVDECVQDPSFKTTPRQIDTANLTTQLPGTTTSPKNTPTEGQKTQRETHGNTTKHTDPDTLGRNGQPKSKDSNHSRNIIIISTIIAGCVVVGSLVVTYFLKKKQMACFRNNAMNQDEKRALTKNRDSLKSSQEVLWLYNLRLGDVDDALLSDVENFISLTSKVLKGWRAIGKEIGLKQTDLLAIEVAGQKQGTNQGEQLLINLKSCKPELTLTEFVTILDKLGRKDVVEIIKAYYTGENDKNVNSAIQIRETIV
ncbi:uncharacterized protein LOC116306979 [Actinia tenebrosa]|uniref:Uncharacterized protein LOC116306979 n=1 Tax=Actinia tenebrosa TaxID=6105 RepID=A0A6P8J0H4_ACTTE|nr:uncharacterized protein LOC116306979 [Actinia tenebrosa]